MHPTDSNSPCDALSTPKNVVEIAVLKDGAPKMVTGSVFGTAQFRGGYKSYRPLVCYLLGLIQENGDI